MSDERAKYQVVPFPRLRVMTADGGRLSAARHAVHGLLEVDVTLPRQILREHKARTGESLSFTAFLLACLGQAVDADPQVHACQDWRRRLYIFEDVNVNTAFAAESGRASHLTHVIKAVNRRSVREIHEEIRAYQAQGDQTAESRWIERFVALPWFVRRLFYSTLLHTPRLQHEYFGTVSLTSIGMFGKRSGWGIAFLIAPLAVTVGGITQKPGLVEGRIEPREFLCLTVSFDHDIIDGAPAARFADHFAELIECASGLAAATAP